MSGSAISFPDLQLVDAADGRGYSKGLTRDQMSDRPYKPGMKLSEAMAIMANDHIDPDLFDIFLEKNNYKCCAEQFLNPLQIDDVQL